MATEDQKFKAGQTTGHAEEKTGQTKNKAGDVVQTTKDWAIAGKDKTTSALGNAAGQVKCAAIGATEAVKNTFGMGAKDTTAGKDKN